MSNDFLSILHQVVESLLDCVCVFSDIDFFEKIVRHIFFKLKVIYNVLLEKAMALHSSTLAWKIPWIEEPGGLQSTGSRRVGHD